MMKYLYKTAIILVIASTALIGSCKKQAKCGCDGDVIDSFSGEPVYVYFDAENNTAQFRWDGAPYATYYFCNPTEMMTELSKFESGEKVLITCDVYYECNYLYQSSNSYYGSLYQAYMAQVTAVESSLYGNN